MGEPPKHWSRRFENPNFDLDRDQADTALLVGDIRRVILKGLIVVVAFSLVLMIGADVSSGLNLLLIVGVPLAGILGFGELLRRWLRRRDGH